MKYYPTHQQNPGTAASHQLSNYVSGGGGPVVDRRGMPIGEAELDGFRAVVRSSESSAMHTFSFDHNIDAGELLRGIREPAKQHLDGNYVIGIHEDTDHNHIHIGEAGSMEELEMPAAAVRGFAADVAQSLGVSYG